MLTPLDIQNAVFHRSWRGYNEAEVDEFLDRLVLEYEQLQRENLALKESRTGETEAAPVSATEERAAWTGSAAEPVESSSEGEAEALPAELERLRQAVREEAQRLEGLRRQRRLFATQFQAMLESYRSICAEQEERAPGLEPGE